MNDDKQCVWMKNKMRCFDMKSSESPFEDSHEYFISTVDDLRESNPFHMDKNCKVQGGECFARTLRIGFGYFVLYLFAGLLVNFLHELVHYSLLVAQGLGGTSFTFSPNLGFTVGTLPPYDASIPWAWWFFETLGPLLIVNFSIVIVTLIVVNHDVKNPPYDEGTFSQKVGWIRKNFLKALAFISGMAILVNTIFSPFYNMYYVLIGSAAKTSDLSWAWKISLLIPEPAGSYMRAMIFTTVSIMITVTLMFIFLFNRRETE